MDLVHLEILKSFTEIGGYKVLYLFDVSEKLIGVINSSKIVYAVQTEILNNLVSLDVELKDIEYEIVKNAEYIGHFDYMNKDTFCMYRIADNNTTDRTLIKAVHIVFDELKAYGYIRDKRPSKMLCSQALEIILDGSRWEVGHVNSTSIGSTNWYDSTRLDALSDFISKWNVELVYRVEFDGQKITGRYIDIYNQAGRDTGLRLVYGSSAIDIKAEENKSNIYTALIGRGKGEEKFDESGQATGGFGRKIDFKDVVWSKSKGDPLDKPLGQEYIELPSMSKLYGYSDGTAKTRIAEFGECTDKKELLKLTYNELVSVSRPRVTFEAVVYKIGNVGIGDKVRIIRRDLDLFYTARAFKIERNLLDNRLTKITLGDYIQTSTEKQRRANAEKLRGIEQALRDFKEASIKNQASYIKRLQEAITKSYLNEDGYNYELKAGNEYNLPAGYYSFNKPIDQNPTKVIYVGAGKMMIANSKKSDGSWNWSTFGTGDGFVADVISAGTLKGGKVKWNLEDGTFLIGESESSYILKFDGNRLKFGTGSLTSESLDSTLKSELKGRDGEQGKAGEPGKKGVGIREIKRYYMTTSSSSTPYLSSSSWSTSTQTPSKDYPYLWSYTKTIFDDGNTSTSSVEMIGHFGRDGINGEPGKDGSLAELPESLKQWANNATEISGSYVYTPEIFIGETSPATSYKTGLYVGKRLTDRGGSIMRGLTMMRDGYINAYFGYDGYGYIGRNPDRRLIIYPDGTIDVPKVRAGDIETGAITTDMLYPGDSQRIILERGYQPGANDARSIDANGDAIRLKYNAGTYIKIDQGGTSCYRGGVQQFIAGGQYNGISVNSGTLMSLGEYETAMAVRQSEGFWAEAADTTVISADFNGVWGRGSYSSSDFTLKENVVKIDKPEFILKPNAETKSDDVSEDEIVDFVKNIGLYNYNFKFLKKPCFSIMAQNVKGKMKGILVGKDKDGKESIDIYNYISVLHMAIKNIFKRLDRHDELEAKVKSLEAEVEELKKLIKGA